MKIKVSKFRQIIKVFILFLVTFVSVMHQKKGGFGGYPSIHSICPFGALETLYNFLLTKEFLAKTYISNFTLLGIILITFLISGRIFCGWLCAFGTLQDIPFFIGKKVFNSISTYKIPYAIDKYLIKVKYFIFFLYYFLLGKLEN